MDNILILNQAAAEGEPVIVGDTDNCDMSQQEFLAAQAYTGLRISKNEVRCKGKEVAFWVQAKA